MLRFLAGTLKSLTMASSYVEVRESSNEAANEHLPFEITSCETNGIDIETAQIEEDPPRDHTYTKDPDVSEDDAIADTSEEKEEVVEPPKNEKIKATKSSKTAKQKAKPQSTGKQGKAATKKGATKKNSKTAPEPESEVLEEEKEEVNEENVSTAKEDDEENISPELSPLKKRSRKRKGDSESSEVDAKHAKNLESDQSVATDSLDEQEEAVEEEEEEEEEKAPKKSQKKPKPTKVKAVKKTASEKKAKSKASEREESPVAQTPKKAKQEKNKSKDVGDADSSLPAGWTKKVVERKSGKTAGLFDVYIYSPEGIKFRSRPDVAAYLIRTKSNLKVEDFNFTRRGLGPVTTSPPKASVPEKKAPQKSPSKRKATGSSKKGGKLVVKLSTPRKNVLSDKQNHSEKKDKKGSQENSVDDCQPSTSGMNSVPKKRSKK